MRIVIEKFMKMVDKISNTVKISQPYNTDTEIFRSEIHIIKLIGDSDELHVSEIARKFGVTKGAVSQLLKKLEKKDLILKIPDETNNTRLLVSLTEKGKTAYQAHEDYHDKHHHDMFSFLEGLNSNELNAVMVFMDKVADMTEDHL